ncbi:hypothetical protein DVH05_027372 [Phytophthora capsici]|nr:hypothetical protein DVH05_027372 [Phytophthora capsici]
MTAHGGGGGGNSIEISKCADPENLNDYSGFPASYELVYGTKGDPAFATRVNDLFSQSGNTSNLVARPQDHMLSVKDHFELGKVIDRWNGEEPPHCEELNGGWAFGLFFKP